MCNLPYTRGTPEEEAALLSDMKPDIQSDIKPDFEVPQVPELLEVHEQAQPAEQTVTPIASPHLLLLP